MIIQEIIAIAGKPGLFRILITNRSNLVVESMVDQKRLSIPGTSRISSLADITMYTTAEDVLLMDVLNRINEHVGKGEIPQIKGDAQATKTFIDEVVPEMDHERVYNSDLKKLIQWFAILRENKAFPLTNEVTEEAETKSNSEADEKAEVKETKPKAKKAAAKKAGTKKPAAKKPTAKKPSAKKTVAKKAPVKK